MESHKYNPKSLIAKISVPILVWATAIVLLISGILYPIISLQVYHCEIMKMGQFGDMFGVLNSLVSILGFAGIFLSLYMQQKQLHVSMQDMKDNAEASNTQTRAAIAQAEALSRQNDIMLNSIIRDTENQRPAIMLKSLIGNIISTTAGTKVDSIHVILTNTMNTPITKFRYSIFGLSIPTSNNIIFQKDEQSNSNSLLGIDILISIPIVSIPSSGLSYFTLAISTEAEDIRERKTKKTKSYYYIGSNSINNLHHKYKFQSVIDTFFEMDIESKIKEWEGKNKNSINRYEF